MTSDQPPVTPTSQPQYQPPQQQYPPQSQHQPQAQHVYPQTEVQHRRGFSRFIPGLVVAVLAIILLVVGVSVVMGSSSFKTPAYGGATSKLAAAKVVFDKNNEAASYTPQEQVAASWYTNDLLVIVAESVDASNKAALDSYKTLTLMIIVSVGVLLLAFGAFFILKVALD